MRTPPDGKPLGAKLGIKTGSRVLLDGAPADFSFGPLPDGVAVHTRPGSIPYDVSVLFCLDQGRLLARWKIHHEHVTPAGRLWVAWPKKSSGLVTDLDDQIVRTHGLSAGRVDTKVCAIDAVWSGLAFVVRTIDR